SEIDAALHFIDVVTQAEENYLAISFFFGGNDIAPALLDDLTPLGFTNDAALLTEAVENVELIQVTSTSTNLYGAILDGLDTLDDALISSQSVAEFQSLTLVTFTDGTDQAGLFSAQDVTDFLDGSPNRYNMQAIGVGSQIDTATLSAIGPNGWLLADNLDSLTSTFGQVGNYVRDLANSFYLVGYISPKVHSTVQRTLRVQASRSDSTASAEYTFTPEYFSGGAGFVESFESPTSEGLAAWVDLAPGPLDTTLLLAARSGPGD
ncbi:MAG: VWA domain-containing protein, partial [Planctomycetota bacterium]|nr:VWA domain-containing protein [Planctomycetota bacterium]